MFLSSLVFQPFFFSVFLGLLLLLVISSPLSFVCLLIYIPQYTTVFAFQGLSYQNKSYSHILTIVHCNRYLTLNGRFPLLAGEITVDSDIKQA